MPSCCSASYSAPPSPCRSRASGKPHAHRRDTDSLCARHARTKSRRPLAVHLRDYADSGISLQKPLHPFSGIVDRPDRKPVNRHPKGVYLIIILYLLAAHCNHCYLSFPAGANIRQKRLAPAFYQPFRRTMTHSPATWREASPLPADMPSHNTCDITPMTLRRCKNTASILEPAKARPHRLLPHPGGAVRRPYNRQEAITSHTAIPFASKKAFFSSTDTGTSA